MREYAAQELAGVIGGTAEQTGGNEWVVVAGLADGKVVVISEDVVAIYASREAWGSRCVPLWESI